MKSNTELPPDRLPFSSYEEREGEKKQSFTDHMEAEKYIKEHIQLHGGDE